MTDWDQQILDLETKVIITINNDNEMKQLLIDALNYLRNTPATALIISRIILDEIAPNIFTESRSDKYPEEINLLEKTGDLLCTLEEDEEISAGDVFTLLTNIAHIMLWYDECIDRGEEKASTSFSRPAGSWQSLEPGAKQKVVFTVIAPNQMQCSQAYCIDV